MPEVTADITISLDGYVAGPNDGPEQGLGEQGERLHDWLYGLESFERMHGGEGGEQSRDSEILAESFEKVGATIVGRRMYDNAGGWGDEPPFPIPVFVLTHTEREDETRGQTTFHFVNDGIDSALERAREAAGDRDVAISGGAQTIQQYLAAGHLDQLQVHIAPMLLGGGIRLFDGGEFRELECTRVVESPAVTHLRYRVKA